MACPRLFLLLVIMVVGQAFLLPLTTSLSRSNVLPLRSTADIDAAREGPVDSCRKKIAAALQPTSLLVQSAHDDPNGSHIAVKVVSEAFTGKNRVQRQQMVYKAIWDELQGPIHAVDQLICRTPEEEATQG